MTDADHVDPGAGVQVLPALRIEEVDPVSVRDDGPFRLSGAMKDAVVRGISLIAFRHAWPFGSLCFKGQTNDRAVEVYFRDMPLVYTLP